MAQRHTGFFADPKVWIAIGALAVSVLSLVCTVVNQLGQNRRWDALNTATVEFKEGKFYVWREMTKEEGLATQWGYDDPLILGSPEAWNKFTLLYFLQLREPATGSVVPHSNPVFTVAEAQAEARRVGATLPVALFRAFRPVFIFENSGKTEATDCNIQVSIKLGDDAWKSAFTSNTPVRIPAAQSINVSFDFAVPLQAPIPDVIRFRIHVDFADIYGRKRARDLVAGWESKRNYWFYGTVERP